MTKMKSIRPIYFASLVAGTALLCAQSTSAIFYVQNFDQAAEGFDNDDPITAVGWNWAQASGSGTAVRLSGQNGADGSPGFAYQFGNNNTSVAWAGQTELGGSLSQSAVTGFSAFIGNTGSNETRFLIEIENEGWFVTTQSWTNAIGGAGDFANDAIQIEFDFTTVGSAWRELAFDGLLGNASSGFDVFDGDQSANALSDPLPSGNIISAGVYMHNPSGGNRFDEFTVIPEPATYAALFGLAALGLVVFLRRRR
jgi:hypothetical protein